MFGVILFAPYHRNYFLSALHSMKHGFVATTAKIYLLDEIEKIWARRKNNTGLAKKIMRARLLYIFSLKFLFRASGKTPGPGESPLSSVLPTPYSLISINRYSKPPTDARGLPENCENELLVEVLSSGKTPGCGQC